MVRAMRRNSRAVHQLFRLRWLLAAFLLTAVVASVYAAGKVSVAPQSIRYVRDGKNADGSTRWITYAEWAARFDSQMAGNAAAGAVEYATTSGTLSSSTIGGLARKAIRGGVYGVAIGLVVDGVLDGAGWAIKELQDQVVVPGTPKEELKPNAWCFTTEGGVVRCANAPGLMTASAHLANFAAFSQPCVASVVGNNGYYYCKRKSDGYMVNVIIDNPRTMPVTGWPVSYVNDSPSTDDVPVTDDQLGEEIRKDPGLVNSLLTDPRTGRPVMTPELRQQGDDLKKRLEEREGLPTSEPSTDPNLEDDTANDQGSPWPSFCGWATTVCDFIAWFKTEPPDQDKPEVPWEEEKPADYEKSWTSGLGGGSCPAPVSFSVSLGGQSASPEFSFAGICQFGTIMRPVIIALAAIIAGFIIAGVRGTKDA